MANFVLIHGSFQGSWIWQPTVKLLRDAGHIVHAPTMDGCAERRHNLRAGITATTMAEEVVDMLFYEDLDDVIIAGTSTSGILISKVAEMVPEKIKRLVYIDALAPQPDETVRDIVIVEPNQTANLQTEFAAGPDPEGMAKRLFADLEPDLKAWALERATLHPKGASSADLSKFWDQADAGKWPATVIYCTISLNPSEAHQRRTADRLNADWHTMEAGHYPMLSAPVEMSALLLAEVGK
ncbi:MAG: alpha/beta hydrolase [Rhodospirillaceae bacterium]|jgi:pimeloyl-ACP methyl ester carboxylesterase|nr:alpha/beta hydrolase [Rhodospirillaceae bacterium]MBT4688931.1 alpha/beta hydrolase [Rhodospirillaceae bacterium]MBT5079892.1 alpha/beta hydrolase [Rhodospirillaceae bacterium]MBT5525914.1 alpha/beta hydrolase [Rhodospirillaceae bacterium]MBT5879476.1 alpha/beta hydrolase [Rhodospirillaceae bacterium]